VTLNAKISQLP